MIYIQVVKPAFSRKGEASKSDCMGTAYVYVK